VLVKRVLIAIFVFVALFSTGAPAQRLPGGPMRVIVIVDSSNAVAPMLTQFRASLNSFLDTLPSDPEVMMVSTGGQMRVRVPPTMDRAKLKEAANGFAADGGGNMLLETMLEADRRFLQNVPDRRPVFVILTTDMDTVLRDVRTDLYNRFAEEFITRGGRAHGIVIHGVNNGITTRMVENLTRNTSGFYDSVTIATAVPKLMITLADYVAADL
jgi:hypothetical protein